MMAVNGPATDYISLDTSLPFDKIALVVRDTNDASYLVYEFCGRTDVRSCAQASVSPPTR